MLTGCSAPGPIQPAPESPVPASWNAPSPTPGGTQADLARWWQQLGDPPLERLIEETLGANPDLDRARAALREARARAGISGAGRFPELGASASAGHSKSGGAAAREQYSASLDASWEIDLFGATRRSVEASRAEVQRAEAQLADAQVSLAAEAGLQYVALRSAQNRLAIARANLEHQRETLQLTDWRVQAGLASSVELEQARTSLEQTAATIPALAAATATATNALAALAGRPAEELHRRLADPAPMPRLPAGVTVGIPADLLWRRPDLRAAERSLAAETARVGEAEANRYPSLRLSGSIGSDALTLGGLGGGATLARSLLAGLSATLFDAGRLQGQVEARQALREQALASYRATLLGALREVEDALVVYTRDGERGAALERATEAARNAALLARQRYRSGLIDFQTVLDTERSLLAVEDGRAVAEAERLSALIGLYKALGGGWQAEAREPVATAGSAR